MAAVKLVPAGIVDETPLLQVKLSQTSASGSFSLQVIDKKGRTWNIATLRTDGMLYLNSSVPDDMGLVIDRGPGTIKITRED